MNCNEFEHKLRSRVDSRQHAGCDDLAEHAAHCHECREVLESYILLDTAIEKWSQIPEPDSQLSRSMVSEFSSVLPTAQCRKRRRPALFVTASLSIAFAVCCFAALDSREDQRIVIALQEPAQPMAVPREIVLASGTAKPVNPPTDVDLPKDARQPYLTLIQETVAVIQEGPLQLPRVDPTDSGFEEKSSELVTNLSEPWAKSWKPLGEGLEDAIGHLWSPAVESE